MNKVRTSFLNVSAYLWQDIGSPHANGDHRGDIRENGSASDKKPERPPSQSSSSRSTPSLKHPKEVSSIAEYIFCVNGNLIIVLCVHMIPWVNLKLSQSSYLCAPLIILLLLLIFVERVSILLVQYWWVYQKKCLTITVPRYRCISQSLAFFVLKPHCAKSVFLYINYASPTSGEAYRDRRLTTNFELWVEIFCVSTCFHMRIPKPCLSVCPHPEKRNPLCFVNISSTLVVDASMERYSRVLHHGNLRIWIFFPKSVKLEIWLLTKSWNHLSFVDISLSLVSLVIDTSMENFSLLLHYGNPKNWFFFVKVRNSNFDEELKSP